MSIKNLFCSQHNYKLVNYRNVGHKLYILGITQEELLIIAGGGMMITFVKGFIGVVIIFVSWVSIAVVRHQFKKHFFTSLVYKVMLKKKYYPYSEDNQLFKDYLEALNEQLTTKK